MSSLYIGRVGTGNDIWEIHALTNGHKFRELTESNISDPTLYQQILKGRYQVLSTGNTIYCTAINPVIDSEIEYNPHDDREGTIHFIAVDSHGNIEAALAVAVDLGATDQGNYIGLPLENRWRSGDYPEGDNLDIFRNKYVRLTHNENREIVPFEMAELYRHFKRHGRNNSYARLGLYCGCYHLLVREARKRQETATTLWVFDAIPQYFNLYKYAGAAILREHSINEPPKLISPSKTQLITKHHNGSKSLELHGKTISRTVTVPIPKIEEDEIRFETKEIPFIDGIVDARLVEDAINVDPNNLTPIHFEGFTERDKQYLGKTIKLLMRRAYQEIGIQYSLPKDKDGDDIIWDYSNVGN